MQDELASKQAVKEQMTKYGFHTPTMTVTEFVEDLPSINLHPKTGHWYIDRKIICSNCEQPVFKYHKIDFDYRPKYCPNCGSYMYETEQQESEG